MLVSAIQNKQNQAYLALNRQTINKQTCKFDKIAFSGGFSKLEREALEAVKAYSLKNGVETCRIIKNGKDITSYFYIIETESACKPSFVDKISPNILKR